MGCRLGIGFRQRFAHLPADRYSLIISSVMVSTFEDTDSARSSIIQVEASFEADETWAASIANYCKE